jgi:prephenate dehydrogenase
VVLTATSELARVRVVGAGMVGTSVALAAVHAGLTVTVVDTDPAAARMAASIGAGTVAVATETPSSDGPQLVVVAVPPHAVPDVLAGELAAFPDAVVTDVASVKGPVIAELRDRERRGQIDREMLSRYVPGHPMAGSERSGPLAARRELFVGRAWAVVTDAGSTPAAIELVRGFVRSCGARTVELTARDHDAAVALVSHLPHVAAATVAALLAEAPAPHLELAGQGVRDVTRIAGSDPELWRQILTANAEEVAVMARRAASGLTAWADALDATVGSTADAGLVGDRLRIGVAGVSRLPGKHGRPELFVTVDVVIPDRPGALAALFADVTSAGVNIEDIRIDHNPANEQGHAQLSVLPDAEPSLAEALTRHGWSVAG